MLSKISRYGIVLLVTVFCGWFAWDILGIGGIIIHEVQEEGPCVGMPGIDHCAGHRFVRPVSTCEAIKIHFETAIHYVGQSHVVTTIDGEFASDYYTRGYSGPQTAVESAAAKKALAEWSESNCKGPINPNSEFWHS